MNKIINKISLAGDKFMPEIHLREPGFTYSAVDRLLIKKKEYKNSKKQEIHDILTKMNQIELAFNMTWLLEILMICLTASHKVLRDKAFNIAKNPKYDSYQWSLAAMIF